MAYKGSAPRVLVIFAEFRKYKPVCKRYLLYQGDTVQTTLGAFISQKLSNFSRAKFPFRTYFVINQIRAWSLFFQEGSWIQFSKKVKNFVDFPPTISKIFITPPPSKIKYACRNSICPIYNELTSSTLSRNFRSPS